MSRGPAWLLVLAFLAPACGDGAPIPGPAPSVRVLAGDGDVELGKAFPLTVVRVWRKGAEEPAWSDDLLAPLVVRLVRSERRENASFVEETRRYRGYAFALGRLTLPALSEMDAPVRLKVRPALDPEDPGPVELPVGLVEEPVRWPMFLGAGLAALLVLAFVVGLRRRTRRAPPPEDPVPEPPDPREVALAALAVLQDRKPATTREIQAYYRETSGTIRAFVRESRELPADRMTSEELIALSMGEAARSRLEAALGHCDVVRFARHRPAEEERGRMIESAEAFVREVEPA